MFLIRSEFEFKRGFWKSKILYELNSRPKFCNPINLVLPFKTNKFIPISCFNDLLFLFDNQSGRADLAPLVTESELAS